MREEVVYCGNANAILRGRIVEIFKSDRGLNIPQGRYMIVRGNDYGHKYLSLIPEFEWNRRLLQEEYRGENFADNFVSESSELEVEIRDSGSSKGRAFFKLPSVAIEYLNLNYDRLKILDLIRNFEIWKQEDYSHWCYTINRYFSSREFISNTQITL